MAPMNNAQASPTAIFPGNRAHKLISVFLFALMTSAQAD
jgi:hypothetical protein